MASLINIGLTGIKAHQVALATTGNNVTNTNTPGYSRQRVNFEELPSQLTGAGFIGSGVIADSIERINQQFLTDQLRADTTIFSEQDALVKQASQIDNLLADEQIGLTPAISNFFQALQSGANDPSSVPERELLLSQASALADRFQALNDRLVNQLQVINDELSSAVAEINSLAAGIANLNQAISSAIGAGQGNEPNDLLDKRDELLRQLSEFVNVSVNPQDDFQVDVFIGKGQPLILGSTSATLQTVQSPENPRITEIAINTGGTVQIITSEITGGRVGGSVDFRESILRDSLNSLGRVALVLADTVNNQHALGIDLNSELGGLFFEDVNDLGIARRRVLPNSNNALPADRLLNIEITNSSLLTIDEFELEFNGPTNDDYVISRLSDGATIRRGALPGILPAAIDLDGFRINFESGTFQVGDKFLLQPVTTGANDIEVSISRVEKIAFGSPIRTEFDIGNVGNGKITQGVMLDVTDPVTNLPLTTFSVPGQLTPPMIVRFINETTYDVLDNTDPANPQPLVPPLNNQIYTPGISNPVFTEDSGQTQISALGADIPQIPAAVASPGPFTNGYGAQNLTILIRDPVTSIITPQTVVINANDTADQIAGSVSAVQGVQATAYNHIRLTNFVDNGDASPIGITLNGTPLTIAPPATFGPDELADVINNDLNFQSLGVYATSDGTNLTIKNTTGDDLTVEVTGTGDQVTVEKISPYDASILASTLVTSGTGTAVGGFVDVKLAEGVSLSADANTVFQQAPAAISSYRGFQVEIDGEPQSQDAFTIDYNQDGVSDNRNALALAALESAATVGGVSTYGEAYSQAVEQVGTFTQQAKLDLDASESLLQQSEAAWQSVSGVNLDEEAGRLIQYQTAYNASAQVVSVAQELFDTLLGVFR